MSLEERVLSLLQKRKDKVLSGKINSIPSPFVRFRDDFLGIEQGKYYLVTSSTKGAKTQFASYLFIFHTLLYSYYHPEQIRVKIFYYPLEETAEDVLIRFMSYILYIFTGGKERVSPIDLKSTRADKPVSSEVLKLLGSDKYTKLVSHFENNVIFSSTSNPTGIYHECRKYAEDNGTVYTKPTKVKDDETGMIKEVQKFDYYESADVDEYRIIFVDHASLISTEKGMPLKQSVDKLSEYFVLLRNRYGFSPVLIQQQAFQGESLEAVKENKVRPTIANLSDSKYPSRDCNLCLGLFSPFKYELKVYMGYDIARFRDNMRFVEVLVNRGGSPGGLIALYFDGAVCQFRELPRPDDQQGLLTIYNYLNNIRKSNPIIDAKPEQNSLSL